MTSKIITSNSDPYLTTAYATQWLGVALRTVQLWVDAGKLPAARTPGGHRRIRASDVQALQVAMGIKPTRAPVRLTDGQVASLYAESKFSPKAMREAAEYFAGAIEAAVLAANGLGGDRA